MTDLEEKEKEPADNPRVYQSDLGYPWELAHKQNNSNYPESLNRFQTVNGHDLIWYNKIFGWPTLLLIVIFIAFEIASRKQLINFSETASSYIFMLLRWFDFLAISFIAFLKFKTNLNQAIIAGLSGAIIAGIIISVFQLFWYGQLWTVFNLIGLPLLMIAESFIILMIIYFIFKIINIKK